MTKKNNAEPVEVIHLYNQNHEIYSGLLTLYNVYVPSVNTAKQENVEPNLKIFSEFFSIDSQKSLEDFYQKYSDSTLANQLLILYNEAIGRDSLDIMTGKEFFDMKITEQDFIEARIECEAKGREKGRAEGKAEERNTNIKNSIAALKPVLNSFEAVAKVIMQSFNLTESEATEKVTAYWNLI